MQRQIENELRKEQGVKARPKTKKKGEADDETPKTDVPLKD